MNVSLHSAVDLIRVRAWQVVAVSVAVLAVVLVYPQHALAVQAVTPGASVNVLASTNGGAYTALNNIVVTDPAPDLLITNTFAITAPAGFEFNPAAGADQAIGAGYATTQIDLGGGAGTAAAPAYSVTDTVATWTVTAAGVGVGGSITISGMEIRPKAATTAAGGTVSVTIAGNVTTFNTANVHPIAHVPGPLANFLVEAQGGGAIPTQTAGAAFNIQITARDSNNNTLSSGPNTFTGAGNTADITSNVAASVGAATTATFTNGVLNNHAMTLTGVNNGAATITATDTAGGLGTGAEAGTSAAFTAQPGALANFLVEAQGGGAIPTQTVNAAFNTQITARDANNNTLAFGTNNFTGAGNTVDITSNVAASAGTGATATFTNGVLNNHSVTLTAANAAGTITATDTNPGGLGNGTQAGTSAAFIVQAVVVPDPDPDPTPSATSLTETGGITVAVLAPQSTTIGSTDATTSASATSGTVAADAPAGALPSGSKLTVAPASSITTLQSLAPAPTGAKILFGAVVQATTSGGAALTSNFTKPVTVTLTLPAGAIAAGTDPATLTLAFWDGSAWVTLPGTVTVGADGSAVLTASVEHFTLFSILQLPAKTEGFTGTAPVSGQIGLLVASGASTPASLVTSLKAAGCPVGSLAVLGTGTWSVYIEGAPANVNVGFPASVEAGAPFFVRCN